MEVDFELYREELTVPGDPPFRISYIDVVPESYIGTMVFVHGYGGYAMQWKYQLREFSDQYRVIAYDVRGHGRSDAPYTQYTMDELQADLDLLLADLRVETPFILVGHSFGGAIVTEFARRRPDALSHLVLIATPDEYKLSPLLGWILRLPLAVLRTVSRIPSVRKSMAARPHALKRLYFNNMSRWQGAQTFPQIRVPTLVIRGDRDRVFPTAAFEQVAQLIPGAEDVNIGVSSHLVPLERADAVHRAIERFVSGQAGEVSWRGEKQRSRLSLIVDRPWLKYYEPGVPKTLALPHRPLHRLFHSTVRRHGSRPALIFVGHTLSYRQLDHEANRLANALRSLGVETGSRVMLLLPNTPQYVIAYYAILKAGGTVVVTSPVNDREELQRQIIDSQADLLITLTLFHQTAREVLPRTQLKAVLYTSIKDYFGWFKQVLFTLRAEEKEGHRLSGGLQEDEYLWKKLYASHPVTAPQVDVNPDSPAVIQYTGGTTDAPKGVMLSHRALLANALQVRHWITNLRDGRESILCALPFSHSYGMTAAMNVSFTLGAKMIILTNFVTEDVLKHIQRYKPTLFPGVPTMYTAINQFKGVRKYGISSIKACISGAAPLPVEVQEAFEKLTRGRLVEGYGLTEAGPVTHANPMNGMRKVGTIGVPIPGTDARILDLTTSEPLAAGQIGELAVRGPQVMDGYWNDAEKSDRVFTKDGWLLTGDLARMDQDGYFQIISRKKDMILAGMYQVYPRDVEEVLYEHPNVKEVAVIGLTISTNGDQRVKAYVVPRSGSKLSKDELLALCRRRLQEYAVPWEIEFREELPKSFVGKVLRRLLIEETGEYTQIEP